MARRSPLLFLLLLPALALGALVWLDQNPRAPESAAGMVAAHADLEASVAELAEAAPIAEEAPQESASLDDAATRTDRRVEVATRIEGRITYDNGAMPGGEVLVLAGPTRASWQWERAARRIWAGLSSDALVHGFADAGGQFALDWTGSDTKLAVVALAPTASTETPVPWLAADGSPLTLTLEPRAALFVDVKAGAGFTGLDTPSFVGTELLLSPVGPPRGRSSLGAAPSQRYAWGTVDERGRAALLAVTAGQDLELTYSGEAAATTRKAVPALAGGEQRSMTLDVCAGAQLLGRVVDDRGVPLAKVHVRAGELAWGEVSGHALSGVSTDAEGRFELLRVSPTDTHLQLSKKGHLELFHAIESEPVHGEQRDLGDLLLEAGTRIAGQVRHPDGRPAAGAEVSAHMDSPSKRPPGSSYHWDRDKNVTRADELGHFAFAGLPSGEHYNLLASLATDGKRTVARQEGVEDGEKDLVLVLAPAPAVHGRVLEPDGTPHARAHVTVEWHNGSGETWTGMMFPRSTRTDAHGNFRLEFEEPGEYLLVARSGGFAPSSQILTRAPTDVPVELRLRLPLTIRGRVVDAKGNAVAEATVNKVDMLEEALVLEGQAGRRGSATAKTDADGYFKIAQQPAGKLMLRARHPEHASSVDVAVDLQDHAPAAEVVLVLRQGARVRGVLYQKGERAGPNMSIMAQAGPAMDGRSTTTDEAGEFVFERLPAGRWQFSSFGAIAEPTLADMALVLERLQLQMLELEEGGEYQLELGAPRANPVTVRGVVRRTGQPVSGGIVSFLPFAGGLEGLRIASLDSSGRYSVDLPEPGNYLVATSDTSVGSFDTPRSSVEMQREIPTVESHELDIDLPGGSIRGRVRGPDGRAMDRVLVTCSREDGLALGTMRGGGFGATKTDADGHYELTLLAPGTYRVTVGGDHSSRVREVSTAARGLQTGVHLGKDESREGVDFDLVAPGEVRGQVRDGKGTPISAATIFARYASGVPVETMSYIQSDASGHFRWRGLAPGNYTFHARSGGLTSSESAPATVGTGDVAEVELVVGEGAYLFVRVEGMNEADLVDGHVRVDLRDSENRQVGGLFSQEDAVDLLSGDRSFDEQRFGPLPPGSYRASATGPDGKRVEKRVELSPGQERRLRLRLKD